MNIFRVQKNSDNPYVMLDKFSINDAELSWKAKGILAALCMAGGAASLNELRKYSSSGKSSTMSGLNELITAGIVEKDGLYGSAPELNAAKILDKFKIPYEREKTFDGCSDCRLLRFDFYLEETKTAIEIDGPHHFFNIYGDVDGVRRRDKIKDKFCAEHEINLVRIPYTDFDIMEDIISIEVGNNDF